MKLKKVNGILIGILSFMILFLLFSPKVSAEENITVEVPIQQRIQGKTISYMIFPQSEISAFPSNTENGIFSIENENDFALHFDFSKPGIYQYVLKPSINNDSLKKEQQEYLINIWIFYSDNYQLTSVITEKNILGYKVNKISFEEINGTSDKNQKPEKAHELQESQKESSYQKNYPQTGEEKSSSFEIGVLLLTLVFIFLGFKKDQKDKEVK